MNTAVPGVISSGRLISFLAFAGRQLRMHLRPHTRCGAYLLLSPPPYLTCLAEGGLRPFLLEASMQRCRTSWSDCLWLMAECDGLQGAKEWKGLYKSALFNLEQKQSEVDSLVNCLQKSEAERCAAHMRSPTNFHNGFLI